jgi:hypothetical protein
MMVFSISVLKRLSGMSHPPLLLNCSSNRRVTTVNIVCKGVGVLGIEVKESESKDIAVRGYGGL